MEKQGCCKYGKRDKDCKAFAKEHEGKSLVEKLALMFEVEYMMTPKLNSDGSFTITMSGHQNGVHTGKTTCSCGMIKKLKQPFSVSSTFCGCCAGHFLYHYQNALSVKLRLKEIVSSPLNSNGENPCSFTFEIVGKPTLDEVLASVPKEDLKIANMFVELAKRNNLKSQIHYATAHKRYKCVFTQAKTKRVVFTLDTSNEIFLIKANLYGIDDYLKNLDITENIISQLQNNAWNCERYEGKTCNSKCRSGVPLTLNGKTEHKCIGGAFTFRGLSDDEWRQVMVLIEKELSE